MALRVQANARAQHEWFCVAVEYRLNTLRLKDQGLLYLGQFKGCQMTNIDVGSRDHTKFMDGYLVMRTLRRSFRGTGRDHG